MRNAHDTEFVGQEAIQISWFGNNLLMEGEIGCRGNLVLGVRKILDVVGDNDSDPIVRTSLYAYNASLRGAHSIFRYDNLHAWPGHADNHHKHLYDWRSGDPLPDSPEWVGAERWPTLGDVIWELERWRNEHADEIPNPEVYPISLSPRTHW